MRESTEAGSSDLTLDTLLDAAGRDHDLCYVVSVAGQVLEVSQEDPTDQHLVGQQSRQTSDIQYNNEVRFLDHTSCQHYRGRV